MTLLPRAFSAPARMRSFFALSLGAAVLLSGCDAFGSKDDATTDEIFEQGEIDPTLVDDVGYVPLLPFYTSTLEGPLDRPLDVAVGFDELLYVPDQNGLHILDLAGRPQELVNRVGGQDLRFERRPGTPGLGGELEGPAASVAQDRRLHVYLTARRDTIVVDTLFNDDGGIEDIIQEEWDLPVVYRLTDLGRVNPETGEDDPVIEDIIWYPFDDPSRQTGRFVRPQVFDNGISDEQVDYTGIGVLPDNSVYITRRGALNSQSLDGRDESINPTNAILRYTADGSRGTYLAFAATQGSLRSAVYPSDIITLVTPPQSTSIPTGNVDFFLAQRPPVEDLTYGVLAIEGIETINGLEYQPDTDRVNAAADPNAGDGFLFEEGKFAGASDLAIGRDAAGLLFVTDAEKDSLFVFNPNGIEGVTLSTTGSLRPIPVSFGGTGSGPNQFSNPQGVAYLDRTVYVADTDNNRISRYRLNTDFE